MSDLEQTQAIYLEDFGEETDEENEDGKKKIVRIFWGNILYFIFYILYFKILLILYVVKKANPNEWKVKPKISLNVDWFSIFHAWIVLEQFLLQVSFLKVLKQEGFPEKLFPLYEGNLLYLA